MRDKEELKEELELYKERLEEAMSAGNLAWWEMELPSGKVRFNDRKAEMLGYQPERFENYTDFTDLVHPDDYKRAMKAMRDHLDGKKERYEVEYRIEKKDGDYKWFRDVGSITEENDDYKKVAGIVIDIDKRKDAEEREGLLNSLLRHDIKNKAQIVQGYLQLLEEEDLSGETKNYINKAVKSSKESINLIQKIRLLLNAQKEEIKKVNIVSMIKDAVEEVDSIAEDNGIDLTVDLPSEMLKVEGGSLLKEVFSNVIENSVYHSDGTKIEVSYEIDDEVVCIIEDDGRGIPDDKKEAVFDRGYTTDDERGTGLGMFLVKMLLESYGGSIELKDSDMGGARFDVHLKRYQID